MKAEIFIPTSNRILSLEKCLLSLAGQTKKDFRIILVGIKKDEKVDKLLEKFPAFDIFYLIQKEKGLLAAANAALEMAYGDVFIRIDDDVILDSKWLQNSLEVFEDEKVGGVTGPTIISKQGLESRDLTGFLEKLRKSQNPFMKALHFVLSDYMYEKKMMAVHGFLESGFFTLGTNYESCLNEKRKEVNNLEACNFSVRTGLLRKIGGFDPVFLRGLGDYHESDAALKIKEMGYKLIFDPGVKLMHNVEDGQVEKARPEAYWRIQNFIIFYFRHFPIKSLGQFIKFNINLFFQNSYYLYRFLTTGKFDQLGAIPGTIVGIFRVIQNK